MQDIKAILALENGTVFHGRAFGAVDQTDYSCGELVFNTSITGYQEIITDPSYCEQIVLFTSVHIGNVGVNANDYESNQESIVWSKGLVIKSLAKQASNWRSTDDLNNYLIKNNLIGICDVDTREITNMLREQGSMRSCIYIVKNTVQSIEQHIETAVNLAKNSRDLNNLDLASEVTTDKSYDWSNKSLKINPPLLGSKKSRTHSNEHIVVYDFGLKPQIVNLLADRNCKVTIVPARTSVEDVIKLRPDGVLLSNGPGDPKACDYAIENTKELIELGVPVFGICLGFQILSLALGGKTVKMKFGHHGANHPVQDLSSKKVLITSQNHGFMVQESSLPKDLQVTHVSLFDKTIQGFKHSSLPVFGFQGHPEASPGPNDIEYLFDEFVAKVQKYQFASGIKTEENISIA